jgi:hypothetical protein
MAYRVVCSLSRSVLTISLLLAALVVAGCGTVHLKRLSEAQDLREKGDDKGAMGLLDQVTGEIQAQEKLSLKDITAYYKARKVQARIHKARGENVRAVAHFEEACVCFTQVGYSLHKAGSSLGATYARLGQECMEEEEPYLRELGQELGRVGVLWSFHQAPVGFDASAVKPFKLRFVTPPEAGEEARISVIASCPRRLGLSDGAAYHEWLRSITKKVDLGPVEDRVQLAHGEAVVASLPGKDGHRELIVYDVRNGIAFMFILSAKPDQIAIHREVFMKLVRGFKLRSENYASKHQ